MPSDNLIKHPKTEVVFLNPLNDPIKNEYIKTLQEIYVHPNNTKQVFNSQMFFDNIREKTKTENIPVYGNTHSKSLKTQEKILEAGIRRGRLFIKLKVAGEEVVSQSFGLSSEEDLQDFKENVAPDIRSKLRFIKTRKGFNISNFANKKYLRGK